MATLLWAFIIVPFVGILALTLVFAFWDKITGKEYIVTDEILKHDVTPEEILGRKGASRGEKE